MSASRRGTTRGTARRRLGILVSAVGLLALLVPVGSAAGEAPGPSATVASSSDRGVPAGSSAGSLESDITRVLRGSPGAVRTGPYEVSWDGGAVVSTWVPRDTAAVGRRGAQQLSAASGSSEVSLASGYAGCPDSTTVHWYCFYEHASYGGRMLQFRDCPSTQSLGAYGFANATTSWVNNRSGATITVYDGSTSGTVLWREYGRSHSSNVGSWANDRADTFTCRT